MVEGVQQQAYKALLGFTDNQTIHSSALGESSSLSDIRNILLTILLLQHSS